MAAATQFEIKPNSDQEKRIVLYAQRAQEMLLNQFSMREVLAEADRLFMREKNWTKEEWEARISNKFGDAHKFRDVTVPIIMPQVRSALGYLTNVFLTGYPIFGVKASPEYEDAASQLETIISENQETACWARELMLFFMDGLKYNIHGIECDWQQRTVWQVKNDIAAPQGAKPAKALWKGNVLRRMDLYNTFWDPRVTIAKVHIEGEYAGYNEILTRVMMKQLCNDLYGTVTPAQVIRALESTSAAGTTTSGSLAYAFYVPLINPYPAMLQNRTQAFDWMSWALNDSQKPGGINYQNVYIKSTIYARIIPSTFGLDVPEKNTPQVWKFIIINGTVVLYAERQSNAHNFIPIFFGQPLEDGLNYQTKSFAMDVEDMQEISSALWNGFIASKRRLVTDRVIYDPLRIRESDINSTNPSAKIPVRPGSYGKPVAEAVYQFPFHDENASSFIQAAGMISQMANLINGQNPAQQGQFVPGNKTQHEYQDVMGHGNTQNQMMAIMIENQVFVPLKMCIKLNILQYQDSQTIYNKAQDQNVEIKMEELREAALQFKVSDGIIPADKMLSEDEFSVALQTIATSPQIGQGYNLAPMFTYIMKTRGVDLAPFEKSPQELQYEQQLAAWQQAAATAAKAGSAFNTPMPKPPPPQQPPGPNIPPGGAGISANTGAQNSDNMAANSGGIPANSPGSGGMPNAAA